MHRFRKSHWRRLWACLGLLGASAVKNLPAMQETHFDPWVGKIPDEEMATSSSILACKIPRTEEPGVLQSMGLQRVGYYLVTNKSLDLPRVS